MVFFPWFSDGLLPLFVPTAGLPGQSETRRRHGLGPGRGLQRRHDLRLRPGVLWEVYLRPAEPRLEEDDS